MVRSLARRALPLLAFFLLPLLLFWQVLWGEATLIPFDNLYEGLPWSAYREPLGVGAPHNELVSDLVLENFQWKQVAIEALRQGELPLWQNRQFAGSPFLATGQHSMLYPLSWLFLLLPIHVAFGWFTVLSLAIAGMTMYAFARVLGLRRSSALLAGLVYQGSGFFTISVVFPMIVAGAAWLPLLLAAIHQLAPRARRGDAPGQERQGDRGTRETRGQGDRGERRNAARPARPVAHSLDRPGLHRHRPHRPRRPPGSVLLHAAGRGAVCAVGDADFRFNNYRSCTVGKFEIRNSKFEIPLCGPRVGDAAHRLAAQRGATSAAVRDGARKLPRGERGVGRGARLCVAAAPGKLLCRAGATRQPVAPRFLQPPHARVGAHRHPAADQRGGRHRAAQPRGLVQGHPAVEKLCRGRGLPRHPATAAGGGGCWVLGIGY